jgi:hypothetical protein
VAALRAKRKTKTLDAERPGRQKVAVCRKKCCRLDNVVEIGGQLSNPPEALLHLSQKLETFRCGGSHTSR